jgi:hypothetical protein
MKNLLIILIVLSIAFLNINAKEKTGGTNLGIRAGLNFPTMGLEVNSGSTTENFTFKSNFGFNVGVLLETQIFDNISFQPGLLWYVKGGTETYNDNNTNGEFNMSINYLHVPLNLLYKVDMGLFTPYIMAGGYLSYAISGTNKSKYGSYENTTTLEFGEYKHMLPFDAGVSFGAGVELSNFRFILNYDLGMINIFTPPSSISKMTGTQKNYVFSVSVGYFLD